MTAGRRILLGLTAAAGFSPTGCALHFGQSDPSADPGDGIRVPKESKFASMVKAPGETVSLAGPGPTSVVATTVTPPSPATPGTVVPPGPAIKSDAIPSGPSAVGDGGPVPYADWPPKPESLSTDPYLTAARAAWEGRPDRVADALRSLDPPTRDAVRPLLLAGAGLALGQSASDPRDLAVAVNQIRAALAAVERRAELRVENARFVEFAYGYRWYDPLKDGHVLRPGEYVFVYAEVTPLAVDALPGGGVGTHVAYTLRITDAAGKPVLVVDGKGKPNPVIVFVEKTDQSRGPVREKHVSIGFAGPHAPGRYTAELEARDQHTGRVAKAALEFRVGGK
jgi:hypothetical protein